MKPKTLLRPIAYLVVAGLALYLLRDPLGDVLGASSRLSEIPLWAWILMVILECLSFVAVSVLFQAVLPDVKLKHIAISQLVSNAASRVIPGGAATGGAVQYKVLRNAGVDPAATGGALSLIHI